MPLLCVVLVSEFVTSTVVAGATACVSGHGTGVLHVSVCEFPLMVVFLLSRSLMLNCMVALCRVVADLLVVNFVVCGSSLVPS